MTLIHALFYILIVILCLVLISTFLAWLMFRFRNSDTLISYNKLVDILENDSNNFDFYDELFSFRLIYTDQYTHEKYYFALSYIDFLRAKWRFMRKDILKDKEFRKSKESNFKETLNFQAELNALLDRERIQKELNDNNLSELHYAGNEKSFSSICVDYKENDVISIIETNGHNIEKFKLYVCVHDDTVYIGHKWVNIEKYALEKQKAEDKNENN